MKPGKYSPALVSGFAAAVLTTVPLIKNIGCCLVIPAASIISLYLYLRINNFSSRILSSDALKFGLLTGLAAAVFATFFDILITYITHSNEIVATLPQVEIMMNELHLGEMSKQAIQLLRIMSKEIQLYGFSTMYSVFIFINNLFSDIIFGIIGGFVGLSILNKKYFTTV